MCKYFHFLFIFFGIVGKNLLADICHILSCFAFQLEIMLHHTQGNDTTVQKYVHKAKTYRAILPLTFLTNSPRNGFTPTTLPPTIPFPPTIPLPITSSLSHQPTTPVLPPALLPNLDRVPASGLVNLTSPTPSSCCHFT